VCVCVCLYGYVWICVGLCGRVLNLETPFSGTNIPK
jgi:hypothetical protein